MYKFKQKHILIALSIVIFILLTVLYSWFNWSVLQPLSQEFDYQYIFNWPDAMATNHFVNQFIQTGHFSQLEPLNEVLNDIVRPRSVNIVDHNIVPSGFLGILILYGFLGMIFTKFSVIYFTPIIATVGVFVFYFFVKEIFNKRTGLIAAFLLSILAPYVFFANQTMLSAVAFLVITLAGFYCLMKSSDFKLRKKTNSFVLLSGFLLGLAISIRYQEAPWILLSVLIVWFVQAKKIRIEKVLLFCLGVATPAIAILLYNHQIYHDWFTVGYLRMNNPTDAIAERLPAEIAVDYENSFLAYLKLIFLPFGFSLRNIYHNFINYLWFPFRGYFIFFVIGLIGWLKNISQSNFRQKIYIVCAALSSSILIIYYGSWVFVDKMVLQNNTISSSYTRYWLPVLAMLLPLLAYSVDKILSRFSQKKYWVLFVLLFFLSVYFSLSILPAFYATGDGLLDQARVTRQYYERAQKVGAIIEPDSLILVEREDKLFFPTYKVIAFEQDYSIFTELKTVQPVVPVYYFSANSDKDIAFINKNKLRSLDLSWELVQEIDGSFRLFKLKTVGD